MATIREVGVGDMGIGYGDGNGGNQLQSFLQNIVTSLGRPMNTAKKFVCTATNMVTMFLYT